MTEMAVVEATKTQSDDSVAETAFGKTLPSPLAYAFEWEEVLQFSAIPPKEQPSNDDILTLVNNKRKANARQKALASALDTASKKWAVDNPGAKDNPYVKPTMEDSVDLQLKSVVAGLVASKKYNEEQATALAKQMLGLA